jgi:predicted MFS family arabinose efflux permease
MDVLAVGVAAYVAAPLAVGLFSRRATWPTPFLWIGNAMTTLPLVSFYVFGIVMPLALPCFVTGFAILAFAIGRVIRHARAQQAS